MIDVILRPGIATTQINDPLLLLRFHVHPAKCSWVDWEIWERGLAMKVELEPDATLSIVQSKTQALLSLEETAMASYLLFTVYLKSPSSNFDVICFWMAPICRTKQIEIAQSIQLLEPIESSQSNCPWWTRVWCHGEIIWHLLCIVFNR